MTKHHYIYKTTCKVTGKFYIGMHSTDNLDDGYLGSGKMLGYSRRKHGDENHSKEILEVLPSREALKLREKEMVNEKLLSDPLCMNLKIGGEGGGKIWNEEHAKSFHRAGWEKMMLGKDFSASTKKAWKNNPEVMKSNIEFAIKAAAHPDVVARRKATYAQRGHSIGEKNSQFGTCWVSNGTPVKIRKEQLEEYLSKGYSRGRIMRD
jgi:hypothetical protein